MTEGNPLAALAFSIKRALQLTCVAVLAMGSLHAAFAQTSSAVEVKPAPVTASLDAVPDVEKAWQAHGNYKKYLELKAKGQEQEAIKIQRAAIEEITTSYLELYFYPVLSERSRSGIRKKVDLYPLQIRAILVDTYLKGARRLMSPSDRGGFAAGISQFMDSFYNGGGNSESLAKNIRSNFRFSDNGVYLDDLQLAGAKADQSLRLKRESNQWKAIIKMLEALDGASAGKK